MDIHPEAAPQAPGLKQMSAEPERYALSEFESRELETLTSCLALRETPGPPCAGALAVAEGELIFVVGMRGNRERVKRIPFSSVESIRKKLIGPTLVVDRSGGREDTYQVADPTAILNAYRDQTEQGDEDDEDDDADKAIAQTEHDAATELA